MLGILRSVCCFLVAASPAMAIAQSHSPRVPNDSQTVVFVCEHGTVKSVVAMAFFAKLAKERNLPLRAISRGTNPDSSVPSVVLDGLRADGMTLGSFTPTKFAPTDLPSAIAVISFDQPSVASFVSGHLPTEAWDGMPAVSDNYLLAREAIRRRVANLLDSLAKLRAGPKRTPRP
jgi:protein-tyrosine-phosphatase